MISKMDIQVEKNKKSLVGTVRTIGSMIDFGVLVLVEIIVGVGLGFHLVYRPVFATELQASKTLIGSIREASKSFCMSSSNVLLSIRFDSSFQQYWDDGFNGCG